MYLIKISGRKSGKPFSTHEKRGHLTASSLNQQLIKPQLSASSSTILTPAST
jgi:hypothetical protein